jgi:hypothetical protein
MENTHGMVGSINDYGMLQGLRRKGFTPPKCLSELKANSIDAEANNLLYNITSSHIKMIDDGKGMKYETISNMFDMHKENHAGEKTRGVSGVGGKVATMILSEEKTVMMYTKSRDGLYYSITIPWDIMFKEGKYTDMIKIGPMNEKEILNFHKERENMKNKDSGVTICLPYNDKLATEIEKQFTSPNDDLENLSFIYGRFDIVVNYKHFEKFELKQMKKYDYFGGENNEYYKGKTLETIKLYEKKNECRYIWDNKEDLFEIKKWGKGYKKNPELLTESLNGWKHPGDFSVLVGCRSDEKYVNEKTIEMPQCALDVPLEYEKKYFGESKNDNLCKPILVRNGQIICQFDLPDVTISNRRANAKTMFQIRHVKCYLLYDPISNLDNIQDLLCGIQENKNQCACQLDVRFSRLVQYIKHKKAEEIWTYFEEIVKHNKLPQPISQPIIDSEESDDDESDDDESDDDESDEDVTIAEETVAQETNKNLTNAKVIEDFTNADVTNAEETIAQVIDVTNEDLTIAQVIDVTNEDLTIADLTIAPVIDVDEIIQELTNEEEIYEDAKTDIQSSEEKLLSTILELQEKLKQAEEKIKYLEEENNRLKQY